MKPLFLCSCIMDASQLMTRAVKAAYAIEKLHNECKTNFRQLNFSIYNWLSAVESDNKWKMETSSPIKCFLSSWVTTNYAKLCSGWDEAKTFLGRAIFWLENLDKYYKEKSLLRKVYVSIALGFCLWGFCESCITIRFYLSRILIHDAII